jgi:hypothetical protein
VVEGERRDGRRGEIMGDGCREVFPVTHRNPVRIFMTPNGSDRAKFSDQIPTGSE